MELQEYLLKLWKHRALIFIVSMAFGLLAFVYAHAQPQHHQAELFIFVGKKADVQSTQFFTYDGYYAQQASESFSKTVIAILESDVLIKDVLRDMSLEVGQLQIQSYADSLRIKAVGPQLISISVTRDSSQEAEKLVTAVVNSLQDQVVAMSKIGDSRLYTELVNAEPIVKSVQMNPNIAFAASLLGGLLACVLFLSILFYFKDPV